jgi:hypothetical protein
VTVNVTRCVSASILTPTALNSPHLTNQNTRVEETQCHNISDSEAEIRDTLLDPNADTRVEEVLHRFDQNIMAPFRDLLDTFAVNLGEHVGISNSEAEIRAKSELIRKLCLKVDQLTGEPSKSYALLDSIRNECDALIDSILDEWQAELDDKEEDAENDEVMRKTGSLSAANDDASESKKKLVEYEAKIVSMQENLMNSSSDFKLQLEEKEGYILRLIQEKDASVKQVEAMKLQIEALESNIDDARSLETSNASLMKELSDKRSAEQKITSLEMPEGWVEVNDQTSGLVYYYNEISGETTWDRPAHKEVSAKQEPIISSKVDATLAKPRTNSSASANQRPRPAHAIATFGFGGRLCVMIQRPAASLSGAVPRRRDRPATMRRGPVVIHRLCNLIPRSHEYSIPSSATPSAPLINRQEGQVLSYLEIMSSSPENLLWNVINIAAQNRGSKLLRVG